MATPERRNAPTDLGDQDSVIKTVGVTKSFDSEFAVRDLTFDVPRGNIFGFVGPSGSGKTTTVRMLTGVYGPTRGEIRVLGRDPRHFSQGTRARIGYMPQLFVLYPHLTAWENLNFAASLYGMPLLRGKQLREVLDFVELGDARGKLTNELSGGMQRRLSLAATLVHDPELIFLDEPTAGIDPVLRRKFWDHFRHLQDQGRTLFITTQYVNEATYCDLVGVMVEGKLLTVDTPTGLRHQAYGGDVIELKTTEPTDIAREHQIESLPFVRGRVVRTGPKSLRIVVDEAKTAIPTLVAWSNEQGLKTESVDEFLPPFDDVFVELVKREETRA